MKLENNRCLVLNGDYSPLGIIDWKKAIIWSIKYTKEKNYSIEILDFYKDDYIIGVNNKRIPIPSVVKTQKYFRIYSHKVNFSRKNLFIRDDYTCQYCGKKKDINELTYDHIVPKSKFKGTNHSPTTWTNIVTACIRCNATKGNRTPQEARMPLIKLPFIPNKNLKYLPVTAQLLRIKENIPEEWLVYLPESYFA